MAKVTLRMLFAEFAGGYRRTFCANADKSALDLPLICPIQETRITPCKLSHRLKGK